MDGISYSSVVGSLMYAMVCTRPDLCHVVSVVSRYMASPGKTHWDAIKWVLRYLRGTIFIGLKYGVGKENGANIMGYVDFSYAGDLYTKRSLTGYIFKVYGNIVSWKSNLQSVVALSTTEAEYIVVIEALKEAMWLWRLVEELGIILEHVKVFCDSQNALHLTKHQVYHERTKHIDVKLHFIHDIVSGEVINMKKIFTKDNLEDMLTKALPMNKLKHCLDLVNVKTQ